MRIIQIINVRWFNATAWYGLWLSKLLQDAGHETRIFTLPGTDNWEKAREFGFEPEYLPFNSKNPFTSPGLYYRLRRMVKAFKPDIINCHRGEGFVFCALLREELKSFGLVRTRGDQRPPKTNWPNLILHKHATDEIIATNSRTANYFINEMKIPKNKVHTILGGVDTAKFVYTEEGRKAVRAEFKFKDSDFVIGLLGRYDEVKGHRDLLRAVAQLRNLKQQENLKILFIGHPTPHFPEEKLRKYAQKLGISDLVRYTGKRNEISACISALDTGVVASLWSEAIARAALEIMACNRPLISTTVGVMPDLLPSTAMYLPGNVEELAKLLFSIRGDTQFKHELLQHQNSCIQKLSAKYFLNSTLDVYHSALSKSKRP